MSETTRPSNARIGEDQILAFLGEATGWGFDPQRVALTRELEFPSFLDAMAYLQRIAPLAEALDHHPELFNVYNRVSIVLTTHDTGGVSALDLALARQMEDAIEP